MCLSDTHTKVNSPRELVDLETAAQQTHTHTPDCKLRGFGFQHRVSEDTRPPPKPFLLLGFSFFSEHAPSPPEDIGRAVNRAINL